MIQQKRNWHPDWTIKERHLIMREISRCNARIRRAEESYRQADDKIKELQRNQVTAINQRYLFNIRLNVLKKKAEGGKGYGNGAVTKR